MKGTPFSKLLPRALVRAGAPLKAPYGRVGLWRRPPYPDLACPDPRTAAMSQGTKPLNLKQNWLLKTFKNLHIELYEKKPLPSLVFFVTSKELELSKLLNHFVNP